MVTAWNCCAMITACITTAGNVEVPPGARDLMEILGSVPPECGRSWPAMEISSWRRWLFVTIAVQTGVRVVALTR